MKKLATILLLTVLTSFALATDVKISQLPLGSGASIGVNDSFPYVAASSGVTRRLTIFDIVNVPLMVSTYAPLASPTFTGVVTAPSFVGALTGTASGNTTYTPTNHGVVVSSGTNAMSVIAPDASTSKVLLSGGVSANPTWGAPFSLGAVGASPNANAASFSSGVLNLQPFGTSAPGVVAASGGGTSNFLRADGTWTVPPVSGTVAVANGGTGLTSGTSGGILGFTASGTIASSAALTANQVVIGGGAGATPTALAAGSLNQVLKMGASNPAWGLVTLSAVNTSVTGTLDVANGGTSQTSALSAFNSFYESVATTLGDLVYGSTVGQPARLAGNITTTKKYLNSTGNGSVALAPSWVQVDFADLSGSVASTQMPALTGDVTTSAGTVATTAAATQANIVTLSKSTGVAVHGTNTNDAAAAGYVGEYITSTASSVNCATSTQFFDITSISLTAGDWDIDGIASYTLNTGVSVTFLLVGITTTSGNSSTGIATGDNAMQSPTAPTASAQVGLAVPFFQVKLTGTTTYYLKGSCTYVSGTPQVNNGRISARRRR